MDWTEVIFETAAENCDALCAIALMVTERGIYIEDYRDMEQQVFAMSHIDLFDKELTEKDRTKVRVHVYFPDDANPAEAQRYIAMRLEDEGIEYRLAENRVDDEDWYEGWKKHYRPLEVSDRVLVCPEWESCEPREGQVVVKIDPGMAFGTGTHETTRLCLTALGERIKGGERLYDVGTGSGILAAAALLLGADMALACDIDPVAVKRARENARLNGVEFEVCLGEMDPTRGSFDIVTANIVADAIIGITPTVKRVLKKGGIYIMSGIIDTLEARVKAALAENGFTVLEIKRERGWSAIIAQN